MKVAIIEASHWHVPLYLDALSRDEVEVVAVSDREDARGAEIARRFGCKLYTSYEDLLRSESFDVAFAFGRHSDMICRTSAALLFSVRTKSPELRTVLVGNAFLYALRVRVSRRRRVRGRSFPRLRGVLTADA